MKKILKSKKLWLFAGPVISAVIFGTATYHIGKAVQDDVYHMQIDDDIYKHNEIVDKYNELIDDSNDLKEEISDKKKEVKEVKDAMKHRDELNAKIDKLETKVQERASTASDLDLEIKSKQAELDKLTAGVQAKKEEPVQLNAGQYIVGHDVKEGRYKATNIGRGTNFIVYDDGSAVVNTILGTPNGSGDYVFFATDGEIIRTEGQVKLIPVE